MSIGNGFFLSISIRLIACVAWLLFSFFFLVLKTHRLCRCNRPLMELGSSHTASSCQVAL
ncbi:uncharacterized protein BDW70DRAFT_131397, partial [Aspergillus foveolatus]|uniref:uncharacterized protein n=1 Tax=Aspergillus foveolatus TaxID=210207 RepID=UPI003CCCEC3A